MQSIKRDLAFGSAIGALTLACALAWGSPFIVTGPAQAQDQVQQQDQSRHSTFTGTVAREGSWYVVHAFDGETYKLDNADRAAAYAGKTVIVTGTLDSPSRTIAVQNISSGQH